MLKRTTQMELNFSNYLKLYDLLIKEDNFWRQLNEMVDFSFVYEELKDKYSSTMGRTAEDIVRMFKYLLLKGYFKLSDRVRMICKIEETQCLCGFQANLFSVWQRFGNTFYFNSIERPY